jgi:phage tail sheath gpL-like
MEASTKKIRIAGQDIIVQVAAGAAVGDVATAIVAAMTAKRTLPVTGSAALGVVTLTARHKGEQGNRIKVEFDPDDEETDTTCVLTLTNAVGNLAAGAGTMDTAAALTAIANAPWHLLACTDLYALEDVDVIVNDTTGRWSYNKRTDGHVVACHSQTLAQLITDHGDFETANRVLGYGLEGVAAGTNALWGTPPWELAGATAAALATWRTGDTSRACQDRAIIESAEWRLDPPPEASRWDFDDEASLIANGYATLYYDAAGDVRVRTSRTMYTETPGGAPDNSWQEYRAQAILSDFGVVQRARIQSQFQSGGAAPSTLRVRRSMKAVLAAIYRQECNAERMDPETFADYTTSLSVVRNGTDPNRIDITDQPQVTGTASVITIRSSFKLL